MKTTNIYQVTFFSGVTGSSGKSFISGTKLFLIKLEFGFFGHQVKKNIL